MIKIVNFMDKYKQQLYEIQNSVMPDNDKMTKELFLDEFNQNFRHYFIALNDDEVVGYIGLYSYDDDYNIISIAVKSQYQNMSIGTKLLNKAKDFAKKTNKNSLSLEVDTTNIKAVNFYKKNNFVVTNIRKKYYKDNDALIMFCYL